MGFDNAGSDEGTGQVQLLSQGRGDEDQRRNDIATHLRSRLVDETGGRRGC